MKKIEGIYDSDKFGKKELRKIRGGVKVSNSNQATNIPRRVSNAENNGNNSDSTTTNFDSDSDS